MGLFQTSINLKTINIFSWACWVTTFVSEELFIVKRRCNDIWKKSKGGTICISHQNVIKYYADHQNLGPSSLKDDQGDICYCHKQLCNAMPWKYASPKIAQRYNNLTLGQGVFEESSIMTTHMDWPTTKSTTAYYHESSMAIDNKDGKNSSDSGGNRSITTQPLEFTVVVVMTFLAFIVQSF